MVALIVGLAFGVFGLMALGGVLYDMRDRIVDSNGEKLIK